MPDTILARRQLSEQKANVQILTPDTTELIAQANSEQMILKLMQLVLSS